jgi:hypothetical protein
MKARGACATLRWRASGERGEYVQHGDAENGKNHVGKIRGRADHDLTEWSRMRFERSARRANTPHV